MSWLSRVRNGIPFLPKRQSGTMVFVKEWEENYNVCPRCNFHDRIGPPKRFEQLFDAAEYELLPAPEVREDPLRFKDTKRYTDRLKTAQMDGAPIAYQAASTGSQIAQPNDDIA